MSFGENVGLIAITAALTGLLIPTVKAVVDQRHFKEQKRFEAELARQSTVITAQAALLDELATAFWDYMLGLIAVSYYKCNRNDARAKKAFEEYEDKSSNRFGHMQAEFSKARRLVSSDRYKELQELYAKFLRLDVSLLRLQRSKAPLAEWSEHHNTAFNTQNSIIEVLTKIAEEMRLAAV